ncbi:MAG: hypothetical protein ACREEW_10510, partial [Caulobacteraceae bacterium]
MPGWGQGASADTADQDQFAASAPVSEGARLSEEFGHFVDSQSVLNAAAGDFAGSGIPGTPDEADVQAPLDSETLNETYGVPGYLRFNAPESAYDAAFQQHMAQQRQFRDQVLARSNPDALADFGASLTGALVDPVNLGVAAATGGLGEAALGAMGFGEAAAGTADAAEAVSRVGRVMNVARSLPRTLAVGAIDNAPFVAANAALSNYAGDDYTAGDALTDL